MLRARDDLLTDEATLLEVDAGKQVHIGLMRKSFAVRKIQTALRHPGGDAARVVVGALFSRFQRTPRRNPPKPERLGARIRRDSERGGARLRSLGQREDREGIAQGSDRHRRAQPIHVEALDQIRLERLGAVQQITPSLSLSDRKQ